jgi:hypothetical protein
MKVQRDSGDGESVLVQREMESRRAPVSEYNSSFAKPVCSGPRSGGWQKRQRLKLQLVSKGDQMVVPIHHGTSWALDVDCVRRLVRSA